MGSRSEEEAPTRRVCMLCSDDCPPLLPVQEGSDTEMSYKKWTPVPRKVKAAGNDDGDEDYDPKRETEKWSKEMLPCSSSRPNFTGHFLASIPVRLLSAFIAFISNL